MNGNWGLIVIILFELAFCEICELLRVDGDHVVGGRLHTPLLAREHILVAG